MLKYSLGEKLIQELIKNPKKFNKQGRAYQLLQEYFNGFPLETLKELLLNGDRMIQRAAIFVVSELGTEGKELIHEVSPLVYINDQYIQYHALESIIVCSVGKNVSEFIHVIRSLRSNNEVIRNLSMHLISNATNLQLKAGIELCQSSINDKIYIEGLSAMLNEEFLNPEILFRMINNKDSLTRTFGIIIAKRIIKTYPKLIMSGKDSMDDDIRQFSEEVINTCSD